MGGCNYRFVGETFWKNHLTRAVKWDGGRTL